MSEYGFETSGIGVYRVYRRREYVGRVYRSLTRWVAVNTNGEEVGRYGSRRAAAEALG